MPGTSVWAQTGSDRRPARRRIGAIGHRGGMTFTASRPGSVASPLGAAVGAVGLLVAVTVVALRTGAGQRLDEWAMRTVVAGRDTELTVLSLLGRISIGSVLAVAVEIGRAHV